MQLTVLESRTSDAGLMKDDIVVVEMCLELHMVKW